MIRALRYKISKQLLRSSPSLLMALLPALVFSACISTSGLQKHVPVNPDPVTSSTFTGRYLNKDNPKQSSLWNLLYACKTYKWDGAAHTDTGTVSLRLEAGKTLHVKRYYRDSLMASFDLRVRQKGNYLYIKRQLFLIPVPFIFYSYHEVVAVLSEEQGALNVQYADDQFIWILLAAGRESRSLYKYSKTENRP